MPLKTSKPVAFDPSIVADLACPACHGALTLAQAALHCHSCRRAYPIVDGIPILIIDRAIQL